MNLKDFNIKYYTYDRFSAIFKELSYEMHNILFKFSTYSYDTDPQDVMGENLNLTFSLEKKVDKEYNSISKIVELDEWENYMFLDTLAKPLSWENKCKDLVKLLTQAYMDHNSNSSISPEIYFTERRSKLNQLSFEKPIESVIDANF